MVFDNVQAYYRVSQNTLTATINVTTSQIHNIY